MPKTLAKSLLECGLELARVTFSLSKEIIFKLPVESRPPYPNSSSMLGVIPLVRQVNSESGDNARKY